MTSPLQGATPTQNKMLKGSSPFFRVMPDRSNCLSAVPVSTNPFAKGTAEYEAAIASDYRMHACAVIDAVGI